MNRKIVVVLVVLIMAVVLPAALRADVESANKYIKEAQAFIGKGSQYFKEASSKLDLAEASLDDAPEGDKKALKAKIDGIRKLMDTAVSADEKGAIQRQGKRLMEELEGDIGNLVTWPGKADEFKEFIKDPKTTNALGVPAVTALQKQYDTMAKVHQSKTIKELLGNATNAVEELEKQWKEGKATLADKDSSPNSREGAITDTARSVEQIERFFKDLPADNADVKKLRARVDKVKSENKAAGAQAGEFETMQRINRSMDDMKDEIAGMEAETKPASWADYKAGKADAFNTPKTQDFIRRASDLLENIQQEELYKENKDNPKVKAAVDGLRTKIAAAKAKVLANVTKVVDEAEKDTVTKDNVDKVVLLSMSVGNALGRDTPDGKALTDRATKLHQNFIDAGNKDSEEKQALYKKLTEQADNAWPAMMSKFSVAEGFDPNNAGALKGKYIKIVSDNLMGWRFKHGDFPYATKINGVPVAGKYEPDVKAALEEVGKKVGHTIGDHDEDGKWTAIAKVEGSTGKLVELVQRSGDVKVDGRSVGTVEGTDEVPIDAPIVTIVALKAGPVAVAQGQGAVKEDGSISAPVGAAGVAGSGRHGMSCFGVIMGLFSVLVGVACLMKAKFAPLASNAGAVQLTEKVGGQNLAYVGLVGIVLGVIGVLMNLIGLISAPLSALIGLLASAAMIIAGGVASRDFLAQKKILPASIAPMLTQFAVPAGIACAVLGLLTILFSLF